MSYSQIKVEVANIKEVSAKIKEFTLAPIGDLDLLPFSPGSHILVTMDDQGVTRCNPYSLVSNPIDSTQYKIAVRKQDDSRGGSVFMHESVAKGDVLTISAPNNLFMPNWRAKKHVLFAGGVGITPFMSYLPEMLRRGAKVELHYMYHSAVTGAYLCELKDMLGDDLICYDSDESVRCDVPSVMAQQPVGTHLYVCGPNSLLESVQATAKGQGWPNSAIHFEAFNSPKAGKPFVVELRRSKRTIEVKEDVSLLEALEAANVTIESSCRGGVCGRCFTSVLAGKVEHNDDFLSDLEKSRNDCVMPCVSRAADDTLVIDL